jgi:hypothetical protein
MGMRVALLARRSVGGTGCDSEVCRELCNVIGDNGDGLVDVADPLLDCI